MDQLSLAVDDHPLLDVGWFTARFPAPIAATPSPAWLTAMLTLEAPAPINADDNVRTAVRDLLRHGGYKPSGRGKPASEFLRRAGAEGSLASINVAVDLCNVASLHSGLPISVVDTKRLRPPLRLAIAAQDARYVFNASGQEIKVAGLLCLHDADGPCANAVKDSQRTKTHDATTEVLCIVWGTNALPGATQQTLAWYRTLSERAGATLSA